LPKGKFVQSWYKRLGVKTCRKAGLTVSQGKHPNSLKNLIPESHKLTVEDQSKGGKASAAVRAEKKKMSEIWQEFFLDKITDGKLTIKDINGEDRPLTWNEFMQFCVNESPIRTAKEAREATEGSKSQINVTGTVKFE